METEQTEIQQLRAGEKFLYFPDTESIPVLAEVVSTPVKSIVLCKRGNSSFLVDIGTQVTLIQGEGEKPLGRDSSILESGFSEETDFITAMAHIEQGGRVKVTNEEIEESIYLDNLLHFEYVEAKLQVNNFDELIDYCSFEILNNF